MVEVKNDKQSSATEMESEVDTRECTDINTEEATEIDSAFEDNQNLTVPNVKKTETLSCQNKDSTPTLFVVGADGTVLCKQETLFVTYCEETVSSFSEVVFTKYCQSRKACKEFASYKDPDVHDLNFNFDPLEHGFFVSRIKKETKLFLTILAVVMSQMKSEMLGMCFLHTKGMRVNYFYLTLL